MPDLSHLLVFIGAGILLNLTPGPDVVYVTSSALRSGVRSGVAAALGVSAGCLVHITLAALGVAVLIAANPLVFGVLKWLGAIYLFWIGAQKLRAALGRRHVPVVSGAAVELRSDAAAPRVRAFPGAFRGGFFTNALNPKVALFFLAFVPQFIAPGSTHPALVFLALGALFTLNSTWVNALWALAAAWVARRSGLLGRVMRWLDGAAGLAFVAFGMELALSRTPSLR